MRREHREGFSIPSKLQQQLFPTRKNDCENGELIAKKICDIPFETLMDVYLWILPLTAPGGMQSYCTIGSKIQSNTRDCRKVRQLEVKKKKGVHAAYAVVSSARGRQKVRCLLVRRRGVFKKGDKNAKQKISKSTEFGTLELALARMK